jgi:type I restriction-modification system DNA methylase subunit
LPKAGDSSVYVYGQEKTLDTVDLAKMNLAVNGLRGEIKQANTYYEDPYNSFGAFDYVLANPPFHVDDVNLSRVEKDRRFNTYSLPRKKSKVKKSGQGEKFVQLIDWYFAAGMERLAESTTGVEPVCEQLLEVLDDVAGQNRAPA